MSGSLFERLFVFMGALLSTYCLAKQESAAALLDFEILETASHDKLSFTQGWEISEDFIYESSGGYGRSFIRKSSYPEHKKILEKRLPANWFAEGLTVQGDKLFLLSWRQQRGLVLNTDNLQPLAQFKYQGQGWGICSFGDTLFMSNGSNKLQLFNKRFELQKELTVTSSNKQQWQNINELECAKDLIWANIWQEKKIIAINPENGQVIYQLDLSQLDSGISHPEAVLNGIAYDAEQDAFWVTGKLWPKRYLLRLKMPKAAVAHSAD